MTVFYRANGDGFYMTLTNEQMISIGTWENLKERLKEIHKTNDIVIEGRGEA